MKTKIKRGKFPIKVSIKIESPEELCDILSRLNAWPSGVDSAQTPVYKFGANSSLSYELWDKLDDIAYYLGLKKR